MNTEELAIIIATETNLKTLEMYRKDTSSFLCSEVDKCLGDLRDNIMEAIKDYATEPADDMVEISLKFEPDEFERMANAYAADLAVKKEHPEAPAGADVPLQDGRGPTSGANPATQNDQKSPPGEQETAAPTASTETRNQSGPDEPSPVIGDEAESGTTPAEQPKKADRKPVDKGFFQAFNEWLAIEKLSYCEAARRAGVSDPTILSLAKGTTKYPTKPTRKKILAAIRKDQKAASSRRLQEEQAAEPKSEGERDLTPGGLLSRHLKQWLECQSLDAPTASTVLSVSVSALQDILEGHLPVENIIHQLSRHIPTIRHNYKFFMRAVKVESGERK